MLLRHGALLLLVAAALPAQAQLGPEVPLSRDPGIVPAAYAQLFPQIASNGRDFLVLWTDYRDGSGGKLMRTSLDPNGAPAEPFGTEVASGIPWYRVASNGRGYLYVTDAEALASNGNSYLRIVRDERTPLLRAVFVDAEGAVLFERDLGLTDLRSLSVDGGRYRVIGFDASRSLRLKTLGDDGTMTTAALPDIGENHFSVVALAAMNRIMLAAGDSFTIVDAAGGEVKPKTKLPLPEYASPVNIVSDGREFLLLMLGGRSLTAFRISPDGVLRNPEPYLLSATASDVPQYASNGTTQVLVWPDHRFGPEPDLLARAVPDFSALAAPAEGARPITFSGVAQAGVQLAAAGSHVMAVWMDDPEQEIAGSVDGIPVQIAPAPAVSSLPAVAGAPNCFLVAWRDIHAGLLARRYAVDGTPLDAQPLALSAQFGSSLRLSIPWRISPIRDRPGVMFDGSAFVVTDALPERILRVVRVDPATGASQPADHPLPHDNFGVLRPLQAGTELVLPYLRYVGFFSPHVANTLGLSFVRAGSGGSARHAATPVVCDETVCQNVDVASAHGLMTHLFGGTSLFISQSTAEGTPLGPASRIVSNERSRAAAIVWNGSEYVVVWATEDGWIRALRLDRNGRRIDLAPLEVAANALALRPAIAVTPDGVAIGYSRRVAENGNVPRAFMRTLDRLTPARRRGVRH